ncbi:hypothetical protein FACS189435_4700 [Bacteroidia bacterium]|nr:hypothetical protein FACS189435_4700 [Bacteroidia bacterium]
MNKRLFIPLLSGLFLAFPAGAQETGACAVDTANVSTNGNREIFTVVEEWPQFPGGVKELMKFIHTLTYPVIAENPIQGRVVVRFVVNEDGSLSDIEVIRSLDSNLDNEAVRVVKAMPKWIPGKQGGVNVAVKYILPVTFRVPKA